jgi:hypothetical protein
MCGAHKEPYEEGPGSDMRLEDGEMSNDIGGKVRGGSIGGLSLAFPLSR